MDSQQTKYQYDEKFLARKQSAYGTVPEGQMEYCVLDHFDRTKHWRALLKGRLRAGRTHSLGVACRYRLQLTVLIKP